METSQSNGKNMWKMPFSFAGQKGIQMVLMIHIDRIPHMRVMIKVNTAQTMIALLYKPRLSMRFLEGGLHHRKMVNTLSHRIPDGGPG